LGGAKSISHDGNSATLPVDPGTMRKKYQDSKRKGGGRGKQWPYIDGGVLFCRIVLRSIGRQFTERKTQSFGGESGKSGRTNETTRALGRAIQDGRRKALTANGSRPKTRRPSSPD